MTERKQRIPAAVCTVCGAYTRDVNSINQQCGHKPDGKRCKGTYGGAQQDSDWEECPTCKATGRTEAGKCERCDGWGWIYARGRR